MFPYVSRDVATEPPTTVVFVRAGTTPPETLSIADEPAFAISEEHVEPTMGWLQREGKPLLSICFMHSFGKCLGRVNGSPFTCFQIHVDPTVLDALRRHYTNPVRRFLTRTVKVQLPQDLRRKLCEKAGKELKVQYLEYRVQDTSPTVGLMAYEAEYRNWLFSSKSHHEDPHLITVGQCLPFAYTGTCLKGDQCEEVHAQPRSAQVRDQILAEALREVCE